eukprot:SAG31_NODE_8841_length_1377_cov_0.996088_1_plen_142_part_00
MQLQVLVVALLASGPEAYPLNRLSPRERRLQGAQIQLMQPDANGELACDNAAFAELSARIMRICCPMDNGDEAGVPTDCELPASCASTECADVFLPFFDACQPKLEALAASRLDQFEAFNANCEVCANAKLIVHKPPRLPG